MAAKPYLGEVKKAATDETIEPAAKLRSRTGKNASAEQANDAHNHPNHTDKRSHRSPKNLSILDLPRSLLLRRPRLRRGGGRQSFGASRRCRQPSRYERCCEDEAPMMKHCDARGILAILPRFLPPSGGIGRPPRHPQGLVVVATARACLAASFCTRRQDDLVRRKAATSQASASPG